MPGDVPSQIWRQGGLRQPPRRNTQSTTVEGHIQTCNISDELLHKEFTQPLNVVIIAKTILRTQAQAHVVLFSSACPGLCASLDYYSLRFQIEFNFRDAKQYWGLEDFMNISPTGSPMRRIWRCSWSMCRPASV